MPDTQNNSLNLTVIHNENLNGTRNLTQQDIQTPSHFINEEIVHTTVTTTQQNISPIHPNLTTPKNNKATSPQITLQSTVKPSATFAPKFSHMDNRRFRPVTRPPKPRKTFTRNNLQNTIIIIHIRQEHITPHGKPIIIMYVLTVGINQ